MQGRPNGIEQLLQTNFSPETAGVYLARQPRSLCNPMYLLL